jgi:predicted lipoprotein
MAEIYTNREKFTELFRNERSLSNVFTEASFITVLAVVPNRVTGKDDLLTLKIKNRAGEINEDFMVEDLTPTSPEASALPPLQAAGEAPTQAEIESLRAKWEATQAAQSPVSNPEIGPVTMTDHLQALQDKRD